MSLILCVSAVSAENSTDVGVSDAQDTAQEDVAASTSAPTTTSSATKQVKKIDADVDADDKVVVYKKNSYFKVKVKDDDTSKPLKKFNIKLKIYTKSKSKTYTIKTNSKGIAKFNTKNLKLGDHKVVITSAESSSKFKETAHIFVGKKHTTTLKPGASKKLRNKDVLRVKIKNDDDEKEIKVCFNGKAKKTNVMKAVFYLKNKATGKIVKKVDYSDFDDGKWEYPDKDYSNWYVAIKVRIIYVTI